MEDLIIALEEEIGNPHLFVGRKKELDFFLEWASKAKLKGAQSSAILCRRKKGKTSLIQRLYNILYTRNDVMSIPFYIVVEEFPMPISNFSLEFYTSLLTQYFAFIHRKPNYLNHCYSLKNLREFSNGDEDFLEDIEMMEELTEKKSLDAWEHAQELGKRISQWKDQRIIQIIDEFQFLDKCAFRDEDKEQLNLTASYNSVAETKISPILVTGSHVNWLSSILQKMVGRFQEYYLEAFTDGEALEAVYTYSDLGKVKITKESAPHIASVCYNDPYYISQLFCSTYPEKDLTTEEGIQNTLIYETTPGRGKGHLVKVWLEYIEDAFNEITGDNAKKIIIYLSKLKNGEERSREDILRENKLGDMTDAELEHRLHNLVKADLILKGSNNCRYKGLGDKIFAMIFRRIYEEEVEKTPIEELENEFKKEMKQTKKRLAYYMGLSAEYEVRDQIMAIFERGGALKDLVYNPLDSYALSKWTSLKKERFYLAHHQSLEADLYWQCEDPNGCDFVIEVKAWKGKLTSKPIQEFITKKQLLEKHLKQKTGFILYAAEGFTEEQKTLLKENKIMFSDAAKLGLTPREKPEIPNGER